MLKPLTLKELFFVSVRGLRGICTKYRLNSNSYGANITSVPGKIHGGFALTFLRALMT
jgi:hypothetical protein